mgnify:CR=1 FL=1
MVSSKVISRRKTTKKTAATTQSKPAGSPRVASPSWLEIVWKALYQLYLDRDGKQEYFHYNTDICYFIETNWERFAQGKEKTSTWSNTVSSTITTNKRIFKPGPEQGLWGLRMPPGDIAEYKKEVASSAPRKKKSESAHKRKLPSRHRYRPEFDENKERVMSMSSPLSLLREESSTWNANTSSESESMDSEPVQTIAVPSSPMAVVTEVAETAEDEDTYVDILSVSESEDEGCFSDSLFSSSLEFSGGFEDDDFYAALHSPISFEAPQNNWEGLLMEWTQ